MISSSMKDLFDPLIFIHLSFSLQQVSERKIKQLMLKWEVSWIQREQLVSHPTCQSG